MIYELDGIKPRLAENVWIAADANLIGRVVLEEGASVWFGATLRGDNEEIFIGAGSNVQESVIMHTDMGFPLVVGPDCTIGHRALLHGCEICAGTLVGMGAMIMNGAKVGKGCLIGAGALVTEGKVIPDNSLVLGAPGKVVRELQEADRAMLRKGADRYRANAERYRKGLKAL
ncbi:gamma carbonic anhydrase family protein [Thioclava litoralis]|uniref:Gamma carbonic anhydrase family protein n=1 Tax=Thioclava litoralis TaxID=3076557 RepID=A0ABZ1E122_9RHOB|nr:gamma carbonic anhydrase family protein [Thioclava sp. FTW29]